MLLPVTRSSVTGHCRPPADLHPPLVRVVGCLDDLGVANLISLQTLNLGYNYLTVRNQTSCPMDVLLTLDGELESLKFPIKGIGGIVL